MSIVVTTQEELDAAIERGAVGIVIDSPPGVWLELRGSANVVAWGSSHVVARELSHVEARGCSRVVAWGSSHVEARGCSRVVAWGSSHVVARDSSLVEASPRVEVHFHSARAMVTGGIVIDATNIDLSDPAVWVAYRGITTKDGVAVVYKAVDPGLVAGQDYTPTTYTIGSTVEATDWDPTLRYGGGLHFSPTPSQARSCYQGDGEPRFLACEIDVASLVPLGDQCKAPRCRVLHEVDRFGDPVAAAGIDDEQESTP